MTSIRETHVIKSVTSTTAVTDDSPIIGHTTIPNHLTLLRVIVSNNEQLDCERPFLRSKTDLLQLVAAPDGSINAF